MLLKKQTVWLLTMLSLVVVLTVYYTTSPEQTNEFAATEKAQTEDTAKENAAGTENAEGTADTKATDDGSSVSTVASDEVFEEMRLQLDEQRSKEEEQLTETISEAKTAEEKSAAQDKINEIRTLSDNEKMVETLIKAENYNDVLVRTVEGKVNVTVKAEELSAEAANDIVQLVRENLNQPNAFVAVTFDPK